MRQATAKRTITTTKTMASYSVDDLREALQLPEDARVFVHVPGGGDWSNDDLDLDQDTPLWVEIIHTVTT